MIYIPKQLHIGFQNRKDTYTGKLAYVVYHDGKKIRKETSWNSWRDDSINPIVTANEPTSGFVLNKGVGGVRQSYGWNARNEYIRIYDPRDFEFEISVSNLLFILRECDCSKGKGLEGEFVYAWDGTELVLLPVISDDYKKSQDYSNKLDEKFSLKNLIVGNIYQMKSGENQTYLGRLDTYNVAHYDGTVHGYVYGKNKKRHVFRSNKKVWRGSTSEHWNFITSGDQILADSGTQDPKFAKLMDDFYASKFGSPAKEIVLKNSDTTTVWSVENNGVVEVFNVISGGYNRNYDSYILQYICKIDNKRISIDWQDYEDRYVYSYYNAPKIARPNNAVCKMPFAVLENGQEIKL